MHAGLFPPLRVTKFQQDTSELFPILDQVEVSSQSGSVLPKKLQAFLESIANRRKPLSNFRSRPGKRRCVRHDLVGTSRPWRWNPQRFADAPKNIFTLIHGLKSNRHERLS